MPINWDTLKPRKQKMEAWSKDTTKKGKIRKSRKKGNRISGVCRIVLLCQEFIKQSNEE